jgi:hypothetical protein
MTVAAHGKTEASKAGTTMTKHASVGTSEQPLTTPSTFKELFLNTAAEAVMTTPQRAKGRGSLAFRESSLKLMVNNEFVHAFVSFASCKIPLCTKRTGDGADAVAVAVAMHRCCSRC